MGLKDQWQQRLLAWSLTPERLRALFSPAVHDTHFSRHRADVIIHRVRLAGMGFSLLTLLWIPLDLLLLPWPASASLVGQRVLAAAVFFALAWPWKVPPTPQRALVELAILLVNPMLFFALGQWLLLSMTLDPAGQMLMALYQLLPFVVLAGLSLFPLTVLESLLYVLPVLGFSALGPWLAGTLNGTSLLPTLWIMVLTSGVYVLAGVIQLHYMLALINRVIQDELTGAFTHHTGKELIDLYFMISIQHGTSFSLVLVDVDDMDRINERAGTQAGDQALRQVARAMAEFLRRSDMIVRWGSKQFLLLLPNTDPEGIVKVLNKVMGEWFGHTADGLPLTASIGACERIADQMGDWPQMIDKLRERVQQAKNGGKAQAVVTQGAVCLPPRKGHGGLQSR
ncbi:MAG: GGDEF domain-containing protein [Magnetococcus sp. WYHC-3]